MPFLISTDPERSALITILEGFVAVLSTIETAFDFPSVHMHKVRGRTKNRFAVYFL